LCSHGAHFLCAVRRNREWFDDREKLLPGHRHNKYINLHGEMPDVVQRVHVAYVTCAVCLQLVRAGQGEH
jgi:hypothetical protein